MKTTHFLGILKKKKLVGQAKMALMGKKKKKTIVNLLLLKHYNLGKMFKFCYKTYFTIEKKNNNLLKGL